MTKKILIVGDLHFPYCHKPTLSKIYDIAAKLKPDLVIQIGDLYDFFSFTRFARTQDLTTPKQEILEGRKGAEEFWRLIKRAVPKAECHQILGNHDTRPSSRMVEKYPEIASLLDISHLWKFPGVKTHLDSRQEIVLDGTLFMHGYRSKLGDHARFNQQSTVCGHSHRGGVTFFPVRGQIIFELNAGYAADPESVPLSYTAQRISAWTHGCGWIDSHGPRFIPL